MVIMAVPPGAAVCLVAVVVVQVLMSGRALSLAGDRFCGSQNQPARLDALGAYELVGQRADPAGGTTEQDHFQASVLVQMHVSGCDNLFEMPVLHFGESVGDPAGVVIVDQGDDAHCLTFLLLDHLLDERGPHQRPHCLAPVGMAMLLSIPVKPPQ
jgi:hypothetical protein